MTSLRFSPLLFLGLAILIAIPPAFSVSLAYNDICAVGKIETDLRVPIYIQALDPLMTIGNAPSSSYNLETYTSKTGKGYVYIITFLEPTNALLDDKTAKCQMEITATNIESARTSQRAESRIQELAEENAKLKDRIENELNPLKIRSSELEANVTYLKRVVDQNQTVYQPQFADEAQMVRGISKIAFLDFVQLKWAAYLLSVLGIIFGLWLYKEHKLHEGCAKG